MDEGWWMTAKERPEGVEVLAQSSAPGFGGGGQRRDGFEGGPGAGSHSSKLIRSDSRRMLRGVDVPVVPSVPARFLTFPPSRLLVFMPPPLLPPPAGSPPAASRPSPKTGRNDCRRSR